MNPTENYADKVVLERPADGVALIRFDRPDKKNALHSSMIIELGRLLSELDEDNGVRCVILAGTEAFFAAGADIKEMVALGPVEVSNSPSRVAAWAAIESFEKPLIAAVNGLAFGAGCELALVCDFVVAGSNAQFGQPEIRLGGVPGDGGTQRLPRKLSPNLANYMLMTGEAIGAERALQFGFAVEVCDPPATVTRTIEIARAIAARAPAAVRSAKACVRNAVGATLENGLAFERFSVNCLAMTEDAKEGMLAFTEKRPPVFTGR
ncbi:2,3-dehydroadipyl-CoA hydratase [Rhizobium ruizarguesonis]|jgi:enoyl-CoA hydratase|uniref:2,3-dehydroadipyl-CoA hydratase n=2 Tax=Rhizobium TaxID=379 RepID=A0AAE8Q4I4_9HYPH|nr:MULTISPECIES: enoyl-CoA hydratase-related protein [Rhizobium]NEH87435.1 2,3-dehydroadipyl-CoA hydratase [Rhizobium ruizarguesonis]NEI16413.1 2,3-dehydroadipyl-CoA hydratase [Rhizobium ruizarguesonis]NEJ08634.1 2,3-dehydroadipyl-CoA hydratase [Rhizobium ruizarguesonis]NEJ17042.1 2,3-dehydroadipyl-CoA hydratase [Rhizobium ruizarguesonis]NEJ59470.1 2,3-dehydroadipyl-CoA hydratase [Rhizobium ruizarguesonis]